MSRSAPNTPQPITSTGSAPTGMVNLPFGTHPEIETEVETNP